MTLSEKARRLYETIAKTGGGQKAAGDDVRKAGTEGNSLPLCRTGKLGAGGALATFHAGMPRVVGQFADFADWEIALSAELGDCVDIAEDAAGETYTVYSHRYEKESVYHVRETEDGLMVS